jgi:hypothetical protein
VATIKPATRSTGARGGATEPTAIPAATRIAHRSSLTGGLRSRSGPDRHAALDGSKGCYFLQGLGSDPRYLLEVVMLGFASFTEGGSSRLFCLDVLVSEHRKPTSGLEPLTSPLYE